MANAGRVARLCRATARQWKGKSNVIGVAGYLERMGVTDE